MHTRFRFRLRWVASVGLLSALLALPGCGSRGYRNNLSGPADSPSRSSPAAGTLAAGEEPTGAEAAILAAYRAFWDDMVVAFATADVSSPRLDDHATASVLSAVRHQLAVVRALGRVAHGRPRLLRTRIVTLQPKAATVLACLDNRHWLYYDAKTGALRDKPSSELHEVQAGLVRDGTVWKVAALTYKEDRCVAA